MLWRIRRMLIEETKTKRMGVCQQLLSCYGCEGDEDGSKHLCIVTGDKTWVYNLCLKTRYVQGNIVTNICPDRLPLRHHNASTMNDSRYSPPLFPCLSSPTTQPRLGSIGPPSLPETEGTSDRISLLATGWSKDNSEGIILSTRRTVLPWQTYENKWKLAEVGGKQRW